MAESPKPHVPPAYIPKRPGQSYTVAPDGTETLVKDSKKAKPPAPQPEKK